ncbi:TetR/AcrR family transcriptional regulator [Jiangella asiatica]|uniref:TetR/AcrR family transcriptional regulator n=1 Tax=Jiangella asiatica TaxID=2530372 RepID=A0A4R5DIL1_9ACTN|nr:TetR/AcrR family transcriptional regulator [Jiangella asiatica]TDE11781.1 TetR/AcrR family transcriptional regulator [Jiangella asiatica]
MSPRPRAEAREDAILLATLELLAQIGYGAMSMDAVAARARASKATIYRRWSGKAELVVAAVERHTRDQAGDHDSGPDTADLRTDLTLVLQDMRDRLVGQSAQLVLGLMTAMRDDAELARAVRSRLIDGKRESFAPVLRRACERGDAPGAVDHELLAEVSSAILFSRVFVTGESLDDGVIAHLVDDVLLPLVHRHDRSDSSDRSDR